MSIRALLSFFRSSKASVEPVSRTDDPGRDPEGYVLTPRVGLLGLYTAHMQYVGNPWTFDPSPDIGSMPIGQMPVVSTINKPSAAEAPFRMQRRNNPEGKLS